MKLRLQCCCKFHQNIIKRQIFRNKFQRSLIQNLLEARNRIDLLRKIFSWIMKKWRNIWAGLKKKLERNQKLRVMIKQKGISDLLRYTFRKKISTESLRFWLYWKRIIKISSRILFKSNWEIVIFENKTEIFQKLWVITKKLKSSFPQSTSISRKENAMKNSKTIRMLLNSIKRQWSLMLAKQQNQCID